MDKPNNNCQLLFYLLFLGLQTQLKQTLIPIQNPSSNLQLSVHYFTYSQATYTAESNLNS